MESTVGEKFEEIIEIFDSCSEEDYYFLWELLKIEMIMFYKPIDAFKKNLDWGYWEISIKILAHFREDIKEEAVILILEKTEITKELDFEVIKIASSVVKLTDAEKLKVIKKCIKWSFDDFKIDIVEGVIKYF